MYRIVGERKQGVERLVQVEGGWSGGICVMSEGSLDLVEGDRGVWYLRRDPYWVSEVERSLKMGLY